MQIFESTKHFLKNEPTPIDRIVNPFQRFASEKAAGGIILFLSALIAILLVMILMMTFGTQNSLLVLEIILLAILSIFG